MPTVKRMIGRRMVEMPVARLPDYVEQDRKRWAAECEAKRQIVKAFPRRWSVDPRFVTAMGSGPDADWWEDRDGERHWLADGRPPGIKEDVPVALRALAAIYADHPNYQQEWAV